MSQSNTNENPLPGASGEANPGEEQKGEVVVDVENAAKVATEVEPQSEMDFFRKIFFQK